ncbi:flagellar assembly protein FliH, partial [Vibrio parahaemolyticus]|nr:flagellar assembly protein FliH [Vibrio parahaemolyticus]
MAGDRKRGFIRPDEDDSMIEPQRWGLPDYGEPKAKQAKQTAFNYDPGWVPNFDEPE